MQGKRAAWGGGPLAQAAAGRHGHREPSTQPRCRALRGQALRHTHVAASSEQAWEGKSKSPLDASGFVSTEEQRIKNRAKNEGGALKDSY